MMHPRKDKKRNPLWCLEKMEKRKKRKRKGRRRRRRQEEEAGGEGEAGGGRGGGEGIAFGFWILLPASCSSSCSLLEIWRLSRVILMRLWPVQP